MSPLQGTNTKTLKQQVIMRRGSGTSVRSVRDESTWVVTHGYMKAMLGIPLYSYP
jgi:hypothetical protein